MHLTWLEDFYKGFNVSTPIQVIISIVIILLGAFLFTRITKLLKLPNVTAYLFTGIIIGPYVLNMVPANIMEGMKFITTIGISFIYFSIGQYFDFASIKKGMGKIICITLCESLLTAVGVGALMFACHLPPAACFILGAIASTTSGGSTLMSIKQYQCKGEFTETIIKVITMNNLVCLLLFSIVLSASTVFVDNNAKFDVFDTIFLPLLLNLAVIVICVVFGIILAKIITPTRSKDNRLILSVAMILGLVGICGLFSLINPNISISPILGTMVFGAVYINLTHDDTLINQTNSFSAPLNLVFFVLSGMKFDITAIVNVGVAGIVYFVARGALKMGGATLGAYIGRCSKNTKRWIGLTLFPQAGTSIGLATVAATVLESLAGAEGAEIGASISTIVIATGIVFEVIGPTITKITLKKTGAMDQETVDKVKSGVIKVDYGSVLQDVEVIESPERTEKINLLNDLKKSCDKANRYVHTKEYNDKLAREEVD